MSSLQTYKTVGGVPLKVPSPAPAAGATGATYIVEEVAKKVFDLMEQAYTDGVVGPAGPAGPTGATGPAGPAGATGATGPAGPAGATAWEEVAAVTGTTPTIAIEDGKSYQASSTSLTALTLTTGAGWDAVDGMARVRFESTASLTFTYPAGWVCVGDDCSAGVFTPTEGRYWLFIDVRPDGTFLTAQKYEVLA